MKNSRISKYNFQAIYLIYLTAFSMESIFADAFIIIDVIHTGSLIFTGVRLTLIDVHFAVLTIKSYKHLILVREGLIHPEKD